MPFMRFLLNTALVFSLAVFGTGCEGPVGPAGPAGTANVETTIIRVNDIDFSSQRAVYNLDVVTQDVADEGVVLAYTDFRTNEGWTPMPLSLLLTSDGDILRFSFSYEPGQLMLWWSATSSYPFEDLIDGWRVKVVAVPPSQAASVQAGISHGALMKKIEQ